jgi:hypothetical protein
MNSGGEWKIKLVNMNGGENGHWWGVEEKLISVI